MQFNAEIPGNSGVASFYLSTTEVNDGRFNSEVHNEEISYFNLRVK